MIPARCSSELVLAPGSLILLAPVMEAVMRAVQPQSAFIRAWWWTSAYREGDPRAHGSVAPPPGPAIDGDAEWFGGVPATVQFRVLAEVAAVGQFLAGPAYDVLDRGTKRHVHSEYDPKGERPLAAGYLARVDHGRRLLEGLA